MSYLWEKQKAKGDKGEELIIEFMQNRGHEVIDLSNDKRYSEPDIDFQIAGKFVELKTDYKMSRTNNLFLETKIEYYNGTSAEGYFAKSKAEYLFYLDINNKELYIYNFEDLRKLVQSGNYQTRTAKDGYKTIYGTIINKDLAKPSQILKIQ